MTLFWSVALLTSCLSSREQILHHLATPNCLSGWKGNVSQPRSSTCSMSVHPNSVSWWEHTVECCTTQQVSPMPEIDLAVSHYRSMLLPTRAPLYSIQRPTCTLASRQRILQCHTIKQFCHLLGKDLPVSPYPLNIYQAGN